MNGQSGESGDRVGRGQLVLPYSSGHGSQHPHLFPLGGRKG